MDLIKKGRYFEVWCCDTLQASWQDKWGLSPMYEALYPCLKCKSETVNTKDKNILRMLGQKVDGFIDTPKEGGTNE